MKKMSKLFLCAFLLCGCMNKKENSNAEHYEKYENYMELLIDNSKQITLQFPFKFNYEMMKNEDGYSYLVSISDPLVAMYNVQMVVADLSEISESNVAPNIGVFENKSYNMIPNQVNTEKGYYKGLAVHGETSKSAFVLNCLVMYKDAKQNDNYVYYIINADYADFENEEVNANE